MNQWQLRSIGLEVICNGGHIMKQVFIGLGSNIEPRNDYLKNALQLLEKHDQIQVTQKSPIYETVPVDYLNQADFLNMVVELKTSLTPELLLDVCQHVEQVLKRERTIDKGPRTIDLDILLYETEKIETARLEVPHPRFDKRAFVLVPICAIAPHFKVPNRQQTIRELLHNLPEEEIAGVKQWDES